MAAFMGPIGADNDNPKRKKLRIVYIFLTHSLVCMYMLKGLYHPIPRIWLVLPAELNFKKAFDIHAA
jgi:hypothetical protein